jgi:hypothetical protein
MTPAAREIENLGANSVLPRGCPKNFRGKRRSANLLKGVAHPTRFERVTFAFGGQGTISGFQVSSNDQ